MMKRRLRSEPLQNDQDTPMHAPVTDQELIEEWNTVLLPAMHAPAYSLPRRVSSYVSSTIQRAINSGLARLQDPQLEGGHTEELVAIKPEAGLGHISRLALTNAAGLVLVSVSFYASVLQYENLAFESSFLAGLLLIFLPNAIRLLSPAASRAERICLLCILGLSFYIIQLMISPLHFTSFDEFLHWRTAEDILRTQHLFSVNSMLPVSPYYPGLEIVTNAISTVSRLNTFQAGILVINTARQLMILSLFLFYEQIIRSSRMAGIATLVYMTNPHFLFFDGEFSYESLALPLATFMLYILVRYETVNRNYRWVLFTAWIILIAVTITHHMTDYFFDGFLILWAAASLFRPSSRNTRIRLTAIALFAVLLSLAYAFLLPGNPVWSYLSSYFNSAFTELGRIIEGHSAARTLFMSQGTSPAPIWDRILMAASVGFVTCGIPFGLLILWRQHRHNVLAIVLGIVSFIYPLTQIFRLTEFGNEISDRSAAFLFLPIAYVLTIFIAHFWPRRRLNWKRIMLMSNIAAVILLGGAILAAGQVYSGLPGPYKVIADGRSIEPEGLQAATWSLTYLGPDNRIGTDRTNQMLMSTIGEQRVVTGLEDKLDISSVFFASTVGPEEIAILRSTGVRFLVVDMRLSSSFPLEGFYFESDDPDAFHLTHPISRAALTKFNTVPRINRLFDSGNIVIYDVGGLVNESS